MSVKLVDITNIIRSKNAGPYELTFDIMFKDAHWFNRVKDAKVINEDLICDLYKISKDEIISIVEFAPANAIKATIKRAISSGEIGETDVYGAQQHALFLDLELDI